MVIAEFADTGRVLVYTSTSATECLAALPASGCGKGLNGDRIRPAGKVDFTGRAGCLGVAGDRCGWPYNQQTRGTDH